jgi:hypothetical protein
MTGNSAIKELGHLQAGACRAQAPHGASEATTTAVCNSNLGIFFSYEHRGIVGEKSRLMISSTIERIPRSEMWVMISSERDDFD